MADNKENKLTIYQQLNQFLNLDGFGFREQTPTLPQSVSAPPPKENKIIILWRRYNSSPIKKMFFVCIDYKL